MPTLVKLFFSILRATRKIPHNLPAKEIRAGLLRARQRRWAIEERLGLGWCIVEQVPSGKWEPRVMRLQLWDATKRFQKLTGEWEVTTGFHGWN